jgi:hypothetical protein
MTFSTLFAFGMGGLAGSTLMYFAARFRFQTKLAEMRREMGMKAWSNGVALGLSVKPNAVAHPLGHRLESWCLPDQQTLINNLTSFDTYPAEDV